MATLGQAEVICKTPVLKSATEAGTQNSAEAV